MSTSLLYHAFGVRGYEYARTSFVEGEVVFGVNPKRENCRCATCGSADVTLRGGVERTWRTLPIGRKPAKISLKVPRVQCTACGTVRQVEVGFAKPRRRHTKAFARYALELLRHTTIQDAAQHLGVSWDVIKEIQREDLQQRFARPKLAHLRRIAIDEIAVAKGHRYLTVVLDLESGTVVFVGDGKGGDALLPFWQRLKASRARVEAVAMDMSAAYIAAVEKYLPEAAIVFDHFHVVKLMNEKLTTLRRQLHREATDQQHKDVLKGTRWLLLKNPENLDSERDEPQRLQDALQLNGPLATAYYLKEDLRQLWDQPHKTAAWNFLTGWYLRAMSSGIRILQQFARTLVGHMWGLLAWYDYPISTGPLEGTNNKIKQPVEVFRLTRMVEFSRRWIICQDARRCMSYGDGQTEAAAGCVVRYGGAVAPVCRASVL